MRVLQSHQSRRRAILRRLWHSIDSNISTRERLLAFKSMEMAFGTILGRGVRTLGKYHQGIMSPYLIHFNGGRRVSHYRLLYWHSPSYLAPPVDIALDSVADALPSFQEFVGKAFLICRRITPRIDFIIRQIIKAGIYHSIACSF